MRPEQAEGLGREVKEEEKQEVKKQFVLWSIPLSYHNS
jgi:hypothetical protein